ncbi:MAG: hypothetical protein QOE61_4223, partial [Micromonosporaceae bacterium]|nr:hypothetical protein [Micromonosporaceae bacterium]
MTCGRAVSIAGAVAALVVATAAV